MYLSDEYRNYKFLVLNILRLKTCLVSDMCWYLSLTHVVTVNNQCMTNIVRGLMRPYKTKKSKTLLRSMIELVSRRIWGLKPLLGSLGPWTKPVNNFYFISSVSVVVNIRICVSVS
jgi:hypothetical protein